MPFQKEVPSFKETLVLPGQMLSYMHKWNNQIINKCMRQDCLNQ